MATATASTETGMGVVEVLNLPEYNSLHAVGTITVDNLDLRPEYKIADLKVKAVCFKVGLN
mgnify:CR=1 FL=1